MSRSPRENPLSYEGVKRRDQILHLAKSAARTRKRRRDIILTVAVNIVFVLIATVTALVATRVPLHNTPQAIVQVPVTAPITAASPEPDLIQVSYIATDPNIAARLAIKPELPAWRTIDDDELLQSLANAGHAAGIMEVDGRTVLMVK